MSRADAVAGMLWIGVIFYAVFGGADFGAGFWDLIAGDAERGRVPRARIERSLGPVWEANHVWLIFVLVTLWTGFPDAFYGIVSTLYIPLALAAVGVVLRGSGFAFRKVLRHPRAEQAAGAAFAASSVLTPFFMGTAAGAVALGRVPVGGGATVSSWCNAPSLLIGAMFVASGAYLAAVFLIADSHAAGDGDMVRYFRRRALGAALVAGATAAAAAISLHADGSIVYAGLTGKALAAVVVSAVCGTAVLVILARGRGISHRLRPAAVAAVVAVVAGWGIAQAPYLLPGHLKIAAGAAPDTVLTALLVVFGAAIVLVLPSIALLFRLTRASLLEE